mmetsp:Transcript_21291/g.53040  ORF Transcript_21291/g.53040 Transcript_21291/m.53040 type:complete len:505 (-) Transcript_21291:580-2094(-)
MAWADAAKALPLRAGAVQEPPQAPALFESYDNLQAASAHFREHGFLPSSPSYASEDILRGVCEALLLCGGSPLLDAACQAPTFKDCLPNSARQRPLQVAVHWATQQQQQFRLRLDALRDASPPPPPPADEEVLSSLAEAARQLRALATTLQALQVALAQQQEAHALEITKRSVECAAADVRRCRLLEWCLVRTSAAQHSAVNQLLRSDGEADEGGEALRRLLHVHCAPTAPAELLQLVATAPPPARPQAAAELLFAALLRVGSPLAAEVEALFLTPSEGAWVRLAHLTLQPEMRCSPVELARLWSLAASCAAAPPHAELREEISRRVFEAQRGPMDGKGSLAAVEWTLALPGAAQLSSEQRVEALVAQDACEQALLFLRQLAPAEEHHRALLAALFDACGARGDLPRLMRCALLPLEQRALEEHFVARRDKKAVVLLNLIHRGGAGFAQISPQAPDGFEAWSDHMHAHTEFKSGALATDKESLLLHTLRQLVPAREWDATKPGA